MNVLIINGSIRWVRFSSGNLNKRINSIAGNIAMELKHEIKYSEADRFYTPYAEVEKFVWADKIIVHFPVNWFGLPGKFKTYLDTVLISGENELYKDEKNKKGELYGTGGLLKGKQYFLVASWSAPLESFDDPFTFFGGAQPDTILIGTHKLFRFLGMECKGSFHFYNVKNNKNIAEELDRCTMKLNKFLAERS